MSASNVVSITPTVDTAAHSALDVVAEVMTISDAMVDDATGVALGVTVLEDGTNKAVLDILLFDRIPTGTITRNAALVLDDDNWRKCIGVIQIAAADYLTPATARQVATKEKSIVVKNNDSSSRRNLYALVVT